MFKAICDCHDILCNPVGITPCFKISDFLLRPPYRDAAGINGGNFRKVGRSGGHRCNALFCAVWLEGVVQSKIKTASFIVKHSWAV